MVKDNHIDANAGSVSTALEKVFSQKPYFMPVEVEVRNLAELKSVLRFPVDIVMLDNMSPGEIKESLALIEEADCYPEIEVSGNITPERFSELKELGVKCVSMGSLTSNVASVDISMAIIKEGAKTD